METEEIENLCDS